MARKEWKIIIDSDRCPHCIRTSYFSCGLVLGNEIYKPCIEKLCPLKLKMGV